MQRSTDAELIRGKTGMFRKLDNRFGGGHSRTATTVTEYLTSTVGPMLKDASRKETERVELYTAAAELNQLAGWIA